MARTASEITKILKTGSYSSQLPLEHIIDYEEIKNRRLYPSIEVVSNSESLRADRKREEGSQEFEVRIYVKRLGIMSDEVERLESYEDEVFNLLSNSSLGDHRIILQTMDWKRTNVNTPPVHIMSTLRIKVNRIQVAKILNQDGFLIFDVSHSDSDNKPSEDYRYVSVFDTDIGDGYDNIDVPVTSNTSDVPLHFSGTFGGTFVTHCMVTPTDLGSTGDKLNQLRLLNNSGEKTEVAFIYNDLDNTIDPDKILDSPLVEIDQILRLYRTNDGVVFRIIGRVSKPGNIVIS